MSKLLPLNRYTLLFFMNLKSLQICPQHYRPFCLNLGMGWGSQWACMLYAVFPRGGALVGTKEFSSLKFIGHVQRLQLRQEDFYNEITMVLWLTIIKCFSKPHLYWYIIDKSFLQYFWCLLLKPSQARFLIFFFFAW